MRSLKMLHFSFIFALMILFFNSGMAQNVDDLTQPYTLDDHTVVLLHLNDDLTNVSDSTRDGTGFGNLMYLNNTDLGSSGEFGKYLYLDNDARSDSSFIEIPDTSGLDIDKTWTIEGWINVFSVGVSNEDWHTYPKLAVKGHNYWVGAMGDPGRRFFQTGYEKVENGWGDVWTDVQSFQLNTWYHLASIRDDADNLFMVAVHDVSGNLVAFNYIVQEDSPTERPRLNDDPLTIGFSYEWHDGSLNGLLDEFRISNVVRQFPMPPVIKKVLNGVIVHLTPNEDLEVQAEVVSPSGTLTDVNLFYSTGDEFTEVAMTHQQGSVYSATIPGQAEGVEVKYYITAQNSYGFIANSQKSTMSDSGAYYGITYGMEHSMVLAMDFEQSLYDSSALHHTVVDSYGTVKYSDVAKFGNYSLQCDSSYILKVEKPAAYLSSEDMTIDFWLNPDSIFPNEVIMAKWQEWPYDRNDWRFGYRLWWNFWDGRLTLEFFTNEKDWAQAYIDSTMEAHKWYHLIVKYSTENGQAILELYDADDNLIQETATSFPGGLKPRAGEWTLGGDRYDFMLPWHYIGKIDNLKLYNYAANLPPAVRKFTEPATKQVLPDQTVTISADIEHASKATLFYSTDGTNYNEHAMNYDGTMTFSTDIPGQTKGTVLYYYIEAKNDAGKTVMIPGSGANTLAYADQNTLTFSLDFEEGSGVPLDKSGYGSEVTVIGSPQYNADAASGSYSLQYNDTSYIQVLPPAPFLVNDQITVEVSFKALGQLPADGTDLIAKYPDPANTWRFGYRISFQPDGKIRNEIHLIANDPAEANWEWKDLWLVNDTRIEVDKWYHYVLDVGSDSAYVELYDADYNLLDKASMDINGQHINQVGGLFTLGRSWWEPAPVFNGLFDDIKIYNYSKKEVGTAIDDHEDLVPIQYALKQNFPNPFNPSTEIRFSIPAANTVELQIYNILGQKVRTLLSKNLTAGYHKITWNGKSDQGLQLPSGIYFYRIKAGEFSAVKKMMFIR